MAVPQNGIEITQGKHTECVSQALSQDDGGNTLHGEEPMWRGMQQTVTVPSGHMQKSVIAPSHCVVCVSEGVVFNYEFIWIPCGHVAGIGIFSSSYRTTILKALIYPSIMDTCFIDLAYVVMLLCDNIKRSDLNQHSLRNSWFLLSAVRPEVSLVILL